MSEEEVWRNGRRRRREYTLITAFCALPDMIDAAERVLNSRQSQAALADFFLNTPQGPGMRAEICYTSDIDYTMRYAQGWTAVRTMPVRDLVMVLDRVDGRPFRLQIQHSSARFRISRATPPRSSCQAANPIAPISCRRGRVRRPDRDDLSNGGQLSFAPWRIHVLIVSRSQIDSCFLPCGMSICVLTRQSSSRIRLLVSGSPGMTMRPNLVPAITPA